MSATGEQSGPPAWTIYAFGGGMGHLSRGLAIARYAAREGIRVRLLTNSPFIPVFQSDRVQRLIALDPRIELITYPATLVRDALMAASLDEIRRCRARDVLIVDTFPRGIAGEIAAMLATVPAFKVFIHRDLNPNYVREADLTATVLQYDFTIVPGEDAPLRHLAHAETGAWLICESSEVLTRTASRHVLGVASDSEKPLIVVAGSGNSTEAIDAARLALRLDEKLAGKSIVRFASLDEKALIEAGELGCCVWPLLACLRGVDLLIGAGGYHTVSEARATNTRFVGIPQRRLYDRQSHRLLPSERVAGFDDLLSVAASIDPMCLVEDDLRDQRWINGAQEAYRIIGRYVGI